jgi:hypothetical protein
MKIFKDKTKPDDGDRLPFAGEKVLSIEEYVDYAKKNRTTWPFVQRTLYIDLLMSDVDIDRLKRRYDNV